MEKAGIGLLVFIRYACFCTLLVVGLFSWVGGTAELGEPPGGMDGRGLGLGSCALVLPQSPLTLLKPSLQHSLSELRA